MVFTLKQLSEDEKIRMQCEAREDYERRLSSEFRAGVEQEMINTEKERQRADAERDRADAEKDRADVAEAELQKLRKLLLESGISEANY